MECLGQILSSIITIQYHFAYISDIAIISFEYSQRWEIWSINNQYHSYSSLSAHSIQQYHHHHQEPPIQEWWIVVDSDLIHSIIHTLQYYWIAETEWTISHFNNAERREIGDIEWHASSSNTSLNHNLSNWISNELYLIDSRYPEHWTMLRQQVSWRKDNTIHCNNIFKSIIYCSSHWSILLVQLNSSVLPNGPLIRIPFEVSDGISNSNSIINHHYLLSLSLC